jgi:hypothetical protein
MVPLNVITGFVRRTLQQLWIVRMKTLVPSILATPLMGLAPTHLQMKEHPVRMETPVQKTQYVTKASAQEPQLMDVSLVAKPLTALDATVANARNVSVNWTLSAVIFTGIPRV